MQFKEQVKLFIETYKKLQREIDDLNYGGCGIAAYAMLKWANQNTPGLSFKIVYEDNWGDTHKTNAKVYKFLNRNKISKFNQIDKIPIIAVAPGHILIYIKRAKLLVDSKSAVQMNLSWLLKYKAIYAVSDNNSAGILTLLQSIHNISTWNDEFNRPKGIAKIERFLKIKLPECKTRYSKKQLEKYKKLCA